MSGRIEKVLVNHRQIVDSSVIDKTETTRE